MDIFSLLAKPESWEEIKLKAASAQRSAVGPYKSHSQITANTNLFFDWLAGLLNCPEIDPGEWSAEVCSFVARYSLSYDNSCLMTPWVTAVDRFIVPEFIIQGPKIAAETLATNHYGLRTGKPEEAKAEVCLRCASHCAVAVCRQRWEHDMSGAQEFELVSLCPSCLSCWDVSYRYCSYDGRRQQDWFSRSFLT